MKAQTRPNIQFGKVSLSDFDIKSSIVDTSTPAVVISDIGVSEFEGNSNGNFTLVFKHHKRIFIRNRKGFDAATVFISLYNGENTASTEKLDDFEAYTYNVENGKIGETKAKKDAVIQEKINRERVLRKFTFPNVKEGCIVEFSYKIKSPFYSRLRAWDFQSAYPTLWSEYKVIIPPVFDYISSSFGYLNYAVNALSYLPKTYTIRDPISKIEGNSIITIAGEALMNVWAVKDAPAFESEAFVYSNLNHIKRIQFQLKGINYSATSSEKIIKPWNETAQALMKDKDFGAQVNEENNWLNDIIGTLNKPNESEVVSNIYEYVRDKFSCTDYDSKWLSQSLKKTYETKIGTAADLNMLMVAMFRKAGLQSAPVIVSTRENGFVNQNYALPSQYNYTLCRVKVNDQYLMLDASHKKMGLGDIPLFCYNGTARVIDDNGAPLSLAPDFVQENKRIIMKVTNDAKDIKITLSVLYGKIESFQLRNKISTTSAEEVVKNMLSKMPGECELQKFSFDSITQFEKSLQLQLELKYKLDAEADILYLNPILLTEWIKNPFSSTDRHYPIELPYKFKEEYQVEIDVPLGFKVDEVPQTTKLHVNENDIKLEYNAKNDNQRVIISSLLSLSKVLFQKSEYNALRIFFMNMVKKYGEQIVFKRG